MPYGMKIPKSVPSPTGKPSEKSSGVKKMEKGDYSGGPPVKKKPVEESYEQKIRRRRIQNMRIEDALRRSGA